MTQLLNYELENFKDYKLAIITLDDGKANSLSPAMIAEIDKALNQAETDEAIVILTGRAGKFSAGFDLAVMQKGNDAINAMAKAGATVAERMLSFPNPVIIACNGHCLAMGAMYLLSADYRIGAEGDFKIGLNEVALGMTMPPFAKIILQETLTPTFIKRAAMQAEIFNPVSACVAGFLDETVNEENLLGRAKEKAAEFSKLNMRAFKITKLRMRKDMLADLHAAIQKIE